MRNHSAKGEASEVRFADSLPIHDGYDVFREAFDTVALPNGW
ncbi:hypothetical protein N177_2050 [Lutibaculum baratangense AMV1]|uniref:Uncharacterized protein n=1 Tax=Lutibaculum baratangense AMV1 TaxID=631454 RepID=V4RFX6_9HYPH|nr:hypothetical protein N177_2050 [Lutibaculum baratangense AMV1]